jgi:glutamate-ammonia-ligase adenylyltransferase
MASPQNIENLIKGLPDPAAAARFYADLLDRHSNALKKISEALLSDLLTIAAYSPLLTTTILQNPDYIAWLGRERTDTKVRSKEALLESLSRFSLLHTDVAANVMLSRFRRRELLRIYLRDIRRLATVAEITEELSNLADAVIEFALRLAKQELENRFGVPQETDDRSRSQPSDFCVVALGKLGSRELNYSSDIDLLFFYSREGKTTGAGASGSVTNREYFIKLAEKVIGLAGGQSGEGSAYRVDMRLRPRGTIGALALSLDETVRYYETEAREWEQQVLIRSRPIAGDPRLFKEFYTRVEHFVFRPEANAVECLDNVRRSRRRIEDPTIVGPGYNVKLGRGGIREIEFIAQALQLAYGGSDEWLRFPHTLVSLSRLADRGLIAEKQLTGLFDAYDFLRRTEHRLQMEHGLQTHTIPKTEAVILLTARRMEFLNSEDFRSELTRHTENVRETFEHVFGEKAAEAVDRESIQIEKTTASGSDDRVTHERISAVSPHFAQIFNAVSDCQEHVDESLISAISNEPDFAKRLSLLRKRWSRSLLNIVLSEIDRRNSISDTKGDLTILAEESINAALKVTRDEMRSRFERQDVDLSVLALGKLGGGRIDYGSDLDIVLVYEDRSDQSAAELYNRAVEIFVTTLSGVTRDGNLYRIDLRLRPYGKNGASANPRSVIIEYFEKTADVWELLAFVKLRGVTGDIATEVENDIRNIIHRRALEADPKALRGETLRIRYLLEKQRGGRRNEIDIKYGAGGLLDVYFASRYLQLRDDIRDDPADRSTRYVLDRLLANGSLSLGDHDAFADGHAFLSELDHNVRLVTGRSRQLPRDPKALSIITERLGFADANSLLETLSLHRLNVRNAFERVLEEV